MSQPISIPLRLSKSPALYNALVPQPQPARISKKTGNDLKAQTELVDQLAALTLNGKAPEHQQKHSNSNCVLPKIAGTGASVPSVAKPIAQSSSLSALLSSKNSYAPSINPPTAAAVQASATNSAARQLIASAGINQKQASEKTNHGQAQPANSAAAPASTLASLATLNVLAAQKLFDLKVKDKIVKRSADVTTDVSSYSVQVISIAVDYVSAIPDGQAFIKWNTRNLCPLLTASSVLLDPQSIKMPVKLNATLKQHAESYEKSARIENSVRTRALEYYPLQNLLDAVNYLENISNVTSIAVMDKDSTPDRINFRAYSMNQPLPEITVCSIVGIVPVDQTNLIPFALSVKGNNACIQFFTWDDSGNHFGMGTTKSTSLPFNHVSPTTWIDVPGLNHKKESALAWNQSNKTKNRCVYLYVQQVIPFSFNGNEKTSSPPLSTFCPKKTDHNPEGYKGSYSVIVGSQVLYVIYPNGFSSANSNAEQFLLRCNTILNGDNTTLKDLG